MSKEFANKVLGMVAQEDLLTPGFTVARPNDPLDGLFTDEMTENLVAKWYAIASEYQIPQMAQFHAFDAIAQKSERAPIDERNVEKGLIKVKRNTSELLRQVIGKGIREEASLYDYVLDDNAALTDQVVTRAKVARAELMATGKVTIEENGIKATVDYGVPSGHTGLTLDVGAGADEDIMTQLQTIVDDALDEGVVLTGMVCARAFLAKLRQNGVIQKAIKGTVNEGVLVTNGELLAFLDSEYGISQVITDDLTYSLPWTIGTDGRPSVTAKRYYPKEKVTFFGAVNGMKLGSGLWGVPPEEELRGFYDVSTAAGNQYVYLTQWAESDPAVIWTKASALYMPVLYSPNSLYIASVTETAAA